MCSGATFGMVVEEYSDVVKARETEGQTIRVLAGEIAQFGTIWER